MACIWPAVEVIEHQVFRGWWSFCHAWQEAPLDLAGQGLDQGRIGVGIASLIAHQRLVVRALLRVIQAWLASAHRVHMSVGELSDVVRWVAAHGQGALAEVRQVGVPADNNLAERSLRPLVVSRKISGGTRSPAGSQTRMTLSSLFQTWLAQGRNPLHACLRLLQSPFPYSEQLLFLSKLHGSPRCVILQGTGAIAPAYYARSLTIGFLTADGSSVLCRLVFQGFWIQWLDSNYLGMKRPKGLPNGIQGVEVY